MNDRTASTGEAPPDKSQHTRARPLRWLLRGLAVSVPLLLVAPAVALALLVRTRPSLLLARRDAISVLALGFVAYKILSREVQRYREVVHGPTPLPPP